MTLPARSRFACALLVALSALGAPTSTRAAELAPEVDYPLDATARTALPKGPATCRPKQLVQYRGKQVKLEPPSPVFEAFAERLQRFERTLVEVGTRVYGRAPVRLVHVGTYVCRNVEAEQSHLSEHALGNAIDIIAFRFPALDAAAAKRSTLPRSLRGAFTVTVGSYRGGRARSAASERHREFFELLGQTLREGGLFRTAIGPADARHRTHLHLDMAPWSYVRL